MRNRWSASCGVSTPVGSSRIRMRRRGNSAFRISTRCCTPDRQVADRRVEIDLQPVLALERCELGARARRSPARAARPPSAPSSTFSSTVNGLDQHEMLVDHADAGRDRVLRASWIGAACRRSGSRRCRPGRSRRGSSSASTCRRRSRRRCRGSCRPGRRGRCRRLAWTAPKRLSMPRSSTAGGGRRARSRRPVAIARRRALTRS